MKLHGSNGATLRAGHGFLLAVLLPLLAGCASPSAFRLFEDGASLEARVVTLRDGAGREVVLPAMLHIADPAFYADVGARVGRCDLVFAEGVQEERSTSADVAPLDSITEMLAGPATARYPLIAGQLDLALQPPVLPGQLPDRVRNADMTWEELLAQLTTEEREGLNVGSGSPDPAQVRPSEADVALAGLITMTLITGMTRAELARGLAADDRPDIDLPTIRGARERKVVEAALRALEEPGVRRVAIVYGGGHQRGLAELLADHGFAPVPEAEAWLRVFAIDDALGVGTFPFGVEDVVVLHGPGFELELAWGMPLQDHLAVRQEHGTAPAPDVAPLLLAGGQPLLVRARDAAGRPVERPLEVGPVELELTPSAVAEVGDTCAHHDGSLVIRGQPVGVLEFFDGLGPSWRIAIGPRGASLDRLHLECNDDEARPWRIVIPEGRRIARSYRVQVLTGANRDGRWLDRLGR